MSGYHPPVYTTRVGDHGVLWLRPNEGSPPANRWIIIERDGTIRGRLDLPERTFIKWSDGDEVWLEITDEYDVPWLVRCRQPRALEPRTPAAGGL